MTEPDVDALIAWHEEAARRLDGPGLGQTGDYHTKAAAALRTLQDRCKSLERVSATQSRVNADLNDAIDLLENQLAEWRGDRTT